jgi:hypothetical protein
MTGTNCDLFTHKSSRSYLNHLVYIIFRTNRCTNDVTVTQVLIDREINIAAFGHRYVLSTRWFKYDRDDLCVNESQFVRVIFEPPCKSAISFKTEIGWMIVSRSVLHRVRKCTVCFAVTRPPEYDRALCVRWKRGMKTAMAQCK